LLPCLSNQQVDSRTSHYLVRLTSRSFHTARRQRFFNSSRHMKATRDGGSRSSGLIATRATDIELAPRATTAPGELNGHENHGPVWWPKCAPRS
jgi:hypothetical protein